MPVRVGFLSAAHMHAWGYAHGLKSNPRAEAVGLWDPDSERASRFCAAFGMAKMDTPQELCEAADAVIVTSENKLHAEHAEIAATRGCHILCEKPLVTSQEEADRMFGAVRKAGVKLMTAFPCRYSPAFLRLKERVESGDAGSVLAICAANRGMCPHGWFVDVAKSGGGAMIDHVVHVADLLWVLLGEAPSRVTALTGSNMYGKDWEDTAMLTLEYPSGVFATLDSSWSRPQSYKTWGGVTMNVVGESGVLEMDMFAQQFDLYGNTDQRHSVSWYGSDLDAALVEGFLKAVEEDGEPPATGEDGWRAVRVALAGYESARSGHSVELV